MKIFTLCGLAGTPPARATQQVSRMHSQRFRLREKATSRRIRGLTLQIVRKCIGDSGGRGGVIRHEVEHQLDASICRLVAELRQRPLSDQRLADGAGGDCKAGTAKRA